MLVAPGVAIVVVVQPADRARTACGLAGPSSDGYSSGNGLLAALGMGWIVGDSLTARTRTPRAGRTSV